MKKLTYLLLIIISLFILDSCHKVAQVSPIPQIQYKSFTIIDTTDILGNNSKGGRLKFTFEDGDGDVGLNAPSQSDTLADSTNLFFTLFRKKGGVMVPAADNDPLKPSAYRIPYMERLGQDKILKGTISVTFLYLFYSPADTIRYDFYIKDRAENVSNVASTNEIVLSVNGTYK
jgi:hypothetical protein